MCVYKGSYSVVSEKTREIKILKALGSMEVFLKYDKVDGKYDGGS